MLSLLPVVSAATKGPDDTLRDFLSEADALYNEHSYGKLREYLLQFKVIFGLLKFMASIDENPWIITWIAGR